MKKSKHNSYQHEIWNWKYLRKPPPLIQRRVSDLWANLSKGGKGVMDGSTTEQAVQRCSLEKFGEVDDMSQLRWRYRDRFNRPPGLK